MLAFHTELRKPFGNRVLCFHPALYVMQELPNPLQENPDGDAFGTVCDSPPPPAPTVTLLVLCTLLSKICVWTVGWLPCPACLNGACFLVLGQVCDVCPFLANDAQVM
jgi:hypothetical protein